MQVIADLQLHSKYSRAVSQQMVIPHIWEWAKRKGIGLVATGDWTHPLWMREIKANLEEMGNGLLKLKNQSSVISSQFSDISLSVSQLTGKLKTGKPETENRKPKTDNSFPLFLLATEVSSIYSQGGKLRRIHNLIWAPSIAVAEKINKELIGRGANLIADGRPIIGLTSIQVAELVFSIDPACLLIPAHAWTPWFSLYGSESGFDSIDECFGQFAKYIYAIETGLSCYDKKTEVLTKNGWKKFSDVTYDDEICTLNIHTNRIEFQKPTKIHSYNYQGKMYRLQTKRVDLLVTPNHRLLYSPCDFRQKPKLYLKEAELLFNKSKRFKKDGIWIGRNDRYFVLPDVRIRHGSRYYSGSRLKKEKNFSMRSWLKFFGFWMAEGWTTDGEDGFYAVCLANRNNRLLSEMKKILESFGYNVYWDKKINNTIRVRDYQLFHYLKQFGKSSDKFIPPEVKSLSKELLEVFFEYYIKGDGHRYGRTNKGLSATTISTRLRDDLQEIALKMGISAYYKLGYKKGTPVLSLPKARRRGYKQSKDSWIIYFIRKNLHTVLPSTIKEFDYTEAWVDFKGPVYCVTIPNHVIYIRRNGIPVWCGNSDPAMNWRIKELDNRSIVSFSDAHSGPKLGREATVFELAELSFKSIREAIIQKTQNTRKISESDRSESQIIRKSDFSDTLSSSESSGNRISYTIEFYPEEGKYHYTGHRNCGVKQTPAETKQKGTICPVCGRKLTVGVMHRVEQLAGRTEEELKLEIGNWKLEIGESKTRMIKSNTFPYRPPYVSLVPLHEILAEAIGGLPTSQNIQNEYKKLTDYFGDEFKVLLEISTSAITKIAGVKVAEAIDKVRKGDIVVDPGYDGVFGVVKIWSDEKKKEEEQQKEQMSLF